ncbi:hypothetical protein OG345_05730 [Streptomyces sp. NBC_01220]|uniref:hypothetical protein n=1 Tax=Streptomyces sp. NBC_01220 TaxID=2903781 RepID=UPI00352CF113|nr:hypothetical protein OG345_05730 [Streptomyces sp. NBC_01220]
MDDFRPYTDNDAHTRQADAFGGTMLAGCPKCGAAPFELCDMSRTDCQGDLFADAPTLNAYPVHGDREDLWGLSSVPDTPAALVAAEKRERHRAARQKRRKSDR